MSQPLSPPQGGPGQQSRGPPARLSPLTRSQTPAIIPAGSASSSRPGSAHSGRTGYSAATSVSQAQALALQLSMGVGDDFDIMDVMSGLIIYQETAKEHFNSALIVPRGEWQAGPLTRSSLCAPPEGRPPCACGPRWDSRADSNHPSQAHIPDVHGTRLPPTCPSCSRSGAKDLLSQHWSSSSLAERYSGQTWGDILGAVLDPYQVRSLCRGRPAPPCSTARSPDSGPLVAQRRRSGRYPRA